MEPTSPAEFAKLVASGQLVVAGFFCDSVATSKIFEAQLDHIRDRYTDCAFVKIDAANNPDLVRKYKIRALPTTLVFFDKKKEATIVGILSAAAIHDVLNRIEKNRQKYD